MKIKKSRIWLFPFFAIAEAIALVVAVIVAAISVRLGEKIASIKYLFPDIGWYFGGPYVEREP